MQQTIEGLLSHINRLRVLLENGKTMTEAQQELVKAELEALLGDLELFKKRSQH
jgi:hypothetical protein